MLKLQDTEYTITRLLHYPKKPSMQEMLYLDIEHSQTSKKTNITHKAIYKVTCFGYAANKINEFYQVGDKITPKLIVRMYKEKYNNPNGEEHLVLNSSYPPATNTGTKKGVQFADIKEI